MTLQINFGENCIWNIYSVLKHWVFLHLFQSFSVSFIRVWNVLPQTSGLVLNTWTPGCILFEYSCATFRSVGVEKCYWFYKSAIEVLYTCTQKVHRSCTQLMKLSHSECICAVSTQSESRMVPAPRSSLLSPQLLPLPSSHKVSLLLASESRIFLVCSLMLYDVSCRFPVDFLTLLK